MLQWLQSFKVWTGKHRNEAKEMIFEKHHRKVRPIAKTTSVHVGADDSSRNLEKPKSAIAALSVELAKTSKTEKEKQQQSEISVLHWTLSPKATAAVLSTSVSANGDIHIATSMSSSYSQASLNSSCSLDTAASPAIAKLVAVSTWSEDPPIIADPEQEPPPPPPLVPPKRPKNPVLPVFDNTITVDKQPPPPPSSTVFQLKNTLATWFRQRHVSEGLPLENQFLSSLKTNPYEKRIAVVGVHGWFPTKLVRSMIGEPTGTSQKFCRQMVSAVKEYFLSTHEVDLPDHVITAIPLNGEGKAEERVKKLYQHLVSNVDWLEALSSADVILWATHSQGTPVSVMLLRQLLENGHVHSEKQPICLLAMAGIGHGPFPAFKGNLIVKYVEADAARELFEFMDSTSPISQRFQQSLAYILRKGIKTVLIGSLQDQVVPLYSAILTAVSHPCILRAVYIDHYIYDENDFIINLVIFALRLRNLGLSDHGLLEHISEALAGSIYAFEGGHSTIYEETDVYMMALRYLFEDTKKQQPTNDPVIHLFQAKSRPNPYFIPWAIRGILEDPNVRQDESLRSEIDRLLRLFASWNPIDPRLREMKYRLEPLRTYDILPTPIPPSLAST